MLHGCAPFWRPDEQAVRNYVSEEALKRYFDALISKYEALSEVFDSDVLTVDDSTIGAARACVLARESGHRVTIFINPAQIARQRPYWFSRFDAILDERRLNKITFEGREFDLRPGTTLRVFRQVVKDSLMSLPEAETDGLLDELALRLKAKEAAVPEHARTLSLDTLHNLIERGVEIGSHGWDHRDIISMKPEEIVEDLRLAKKWFQQCLGLRPSHYAIPYGLAPLVGCAVQEVTGMMLLANPKLQIGNLGYGHWNRRDISTTLQGRPV